MAIDKCPGMVDRCRLNIDAVGPNTDFEVITADIFDIPIKMPQWAHLTSPCNLVS